MDSNLINTIGDLILLSFEPIKMLKNIPNNLFIAIGFGLLFYWLKTQIDYNKQADREGTLK
jgi:hypothetical protein